MANPQGFFSKIRFIIEDKRLVFCFNTKKRDIYLNFTWNLTLNAIYPSFFYLKPYQEHGIFWLENERSAHSWASQNSFIKDHRIYFDDEM